MTNGAALKHIWIVNHYASLRDVHGTSGRHEELAEALAAHGWTVTLVTSSTSHPDGVQRLRGAHRRRILREAGVDKVVLRAPSYAGNGAMRVLNMVWFAAHLVMPGALRGLRKPDLILGSTVHLAAAWAASAVAKRRKLPFVFEIRDVWPETLIDLGKLRSNSLAARVMKQVSLTLSRRASLVISPLPEVRTYLDENGLTDKRFSWISNGIPASTVKTSPPCPEGPFTFMYLGSHGNANALDDLLDAFDLAQARANGALRLRLVGSGPLKADLLKKASRLPSADTISFSDRVPRNDVIRLAHEASALVATMSDHAVYRYGISLNKLFDYLSSGRPIVFASNAPNNPVSDADAGLSVPASDTVALADAMLSMASTPVEKRDEMGARGMHHVYSEYSYSKLALRLAHELDMTLESARGEHA